MALGLAESKLVADRPAVQPVLSEAREALAVALEELRELTQGIPATMKLLGDRNWYLPPRLQWLPRFAHELAQPRQELTPSLEAKPMTSVSDSRTFRIREVEPVDEQRVRDVVLDRRARRVR
jgi:hypothetical protein